MKRVLLSAAAASFVIFCGMQIPAIAQSNDTRVSPELVRTGEKHYTLNCAPCHGTRMLEPPVQVDLRQFPRDERSRFVNTVINGRRGMPPWRGALSPEEIDAIWAYVLAGEPK